MSKDSITDVPGQEGQQLWERRWPGGESQASGRPGADRQDTPEDGLYLLAAGIFSKTEKI